MFERIPNLLKVVLVLCAVAWVASSVYDARIAPLIAQKESAARKVDQLRVQIKKARGYIQSVRDMDQDVAKADRQLDELRRDFPSEPVVVWFPRKLKEHFESFGTSVGMTRIISTKEEPSLPGWKRWYWAVTLPELSGKRAAAGLALAVAALERQGRFVKVTDLAFRPDLDAPGNFTAFVSLSALAPE